MTTRERFGAAILALTLCPFVHGATPETLDVAASAETEPVASSGDAADDPAIWVNPDDPAKSVVIGTDKQRGLCVYGLDGRLIQNLGDGRMNNVDLREGFPLGGRKVTLVTAGNRTNDSIAIYALDPSTRTLRGVAARTIRTAAAYGSCMYRSPKTGKFSYVLANKSGQVEQWELFDDGTGKVDAKRVRSFKMESAVEGCAADDELGHLYIAEERGGLWKFGAEPDSPSTGTLLDRAGSGRRLTPDVEGIAIAKTGPGRGYLIVSSQGSNSYAIYRREGSNEFVKSFRIVDGASVDGTTDTDGIDVTTAGLGAAFPRGLFVAQDGSNDKGNQNFKLVPLERILGGL